jgi:YHS domain-containing protein
VTWLLRLAILVLIVLALRSVLRWLLAAGWKHMVSRAVDRVEQAQKPAERVGAVEKDPVCGTHVDVELALQERTNGEILYFCSQDCRDAYHARQSSVTSKTG